MVLLSGFLKANRRESNVILSAHFLFFSLFFFVSVQMSFAVAGLFFLMKKRKNKRQIAELHFVSLDRFHQQLSDVPISRLHSLKSSVDVTMDWLTVGDLKKDEIGLRRQPHNHNTVNQLQLMFCFFWLVN